MDYRQIITIEPGKRGSKPCIRPELTPEDIQACLKFAADREHQLASKRA